MKTTTFDLNQIIPDSAYGQRLDHILAQLFNQYSRTALQKWLKQGLILVDGKVLSAKEKVQGGEHITGTITIQDVTIDQPQAIGLNILYEDDDILLINKPAGLVVHPGAGNREGTLLNAVLHHIPAVAQLPRAGIVHRLDKDTSGIMVIAKTPVAQRSLTEQLEQREIIKEYLAIVSGEMIAGMTIDAPISRHPKHRTKMAIAPEGLGKEAISHVRVVERYAGFTQVRVQIETGRTHQIRVHLAYKGYPVVGDSVYGGRLMIPKGASAELITALRQFKRQALHAYQLSFAHPASGEWLTWSAPMPEDMQILCQRLAAH